jgi:nucleosome assembly protein 1-like 1
VAAYKALQAKYHTVYSDLWRKRADIVSGAAGAAPADGAATASKGIEGFWLQALQNGRRTGATIEEHDEPVLKFLTDVRLAYLDDFTGFRLEFVFAPNPYFTNAQLDKTFHIPFMMGGGRLGSDPTIEKIVGCEINWLPGKNVTEKEVKKSQKKKGKKMTIVKKVGERRARRGRRGDESTVLGRGREHRACHMPFHAPALHPAPFFFFTAFSTFRAALQEPVESFFRFFGTPNMDEDADEDMEPEEVYELNEQIQMEMDVGFEIKNKIVPRAVEWFTGEAVEDDSDDEDDDEDDEDDEGDEEDEDDEEDEEEDEECVARAHARARARNARTAAAAAATRALPFALCARVCAGMSRRPRRAARRARRARRAARTRRRWPPPWRTRSRSPSHLSRARSPTPAAAAAPAVAAAATAARPRATARPAATSPSASSSRGGEAR